VTGGFCAQPVPKRPNMSVTMKEKMRSVQNVPERDALTRKRFNLAVMDECTVLEKT
jgi:hypothetical protein